MGQSSSKLALNQVRISNHFIDKYWQYREENKETQFKFTQEEAQILPIQDIFLMNNNQYNYKEEKFDLTKLKIFIKPLSPLTILYELQDVSKFIQDCIFGDKSQVLVMLLYKLQQRFLIKPLKQIFSQKNLREILFQVGQKVVAASDLQNNIENFDDQFQYIQFDFALWIKIVDQMIYLNQNQERSIISLDDNGQKIQDQLISIITSGVISEILSIDKRYSLFQKQEDVFTGIISKIQSFFEIFQRTKETIAYQYKELFLFNLDLLDELKLLIEDENEPEFTDETLLIDAEQMQKIFQSMLARNSDYLPDFVEQQVNEENLDQQQEEDDDIIGESEVQHDYENQNQDQPNVPSVQINTYLNQREDSDQFISHSNNDDYDNNYQRYESYLDLDL
ncbi:UNKNOWN [Stylonychia lemnae]|uniref:Uncharacterized protein n=1 Tax=Stylonychia lemnae TaxID=5949 RepID=A0A078AC57_STYLE|nr:UNKNOWN [Stylonychia lemnae]|eukprot:CDW78368.1 UNKNOWN [Stylonychia lemnae]